jgi:hypothetical protein
MNTIDAARRALAHIAHLIKMVSRAEVAGQTVDNLPAGGRRVDELPQWVVFLANVMMLTGSSAAVRPVRTSRLHEKQHWNVGSPGPALCNLAIASAIVMRMGTAASADEANDIRAGHDLAAKVCSPCPVFDERPGPSFGEIAKGEGATDALLRFCTLTGSRGAVSTRLGPYSIKRRAAS